VSSEKVKKSRSAYESWAAKLDPNSDEDLKPADVARLLRDWTTSATAYARARRKRFTVASTIVRLVGLGLIASSTIILGLQNLEFWPSVGFVTLALATFVTGLETFFNWRSRWVLSEEAMYRFYRLKDELDFILLLHKSDAITKQQVESLFDKYQETWDSFSLGWLDERRRVGNGSSI
jgi:hypothetical protein